MCVCIHANTLQACARSLNVYKKSVQIVFIHHVSFAPRSGMNFHFFRMPRVNVAIAAIVTSRAFSLRQNNAKLAKYSDKRYRTRITCQQK